MYSHRLYLITDFELVVSFNGRDNAGTENGDRSAARVFLGGGSEDYIIGRPSTEWSTALEWSSELWRGPRRVWRGGEGSLPDASSSSVIRMPSTYGRLVRRLCGNYDGNQSSEYVLTEGTLTKNINKFGNSWEAKKITTGLARISR